MLFLFGAELSDPSNIYIANGELTGFLTTDQTEFNYVLHINNLAGIKAAYFYLDNILNANKIVKNIAINLKMGFIIDKWSIYDAFDSLSHELINDLKNGHIYVNVCTDLFPKGAMNGQIYPLYSNI